MSAARKTGPPKQPEALPSSRKREIPALYEELAPELLRYAGAMTRDWGRAQDSVQETFLHYLACRAHGETIRHPRAWLFRALRNQVLDAAKKKKEVTLDDVADAAAGQAAPEVDFRQPELEGRIRGVLAPRELQCFRMRAEGLRYEEIAARLQVRPGTVGALLARAQDKMRRALRPAAASQNSGPDRSAG